MKTKPYSFDVYVRDRVKFMLTLFVVVMLTAVVFTVVESLFVQFGTTDSSYLPFAQAVPTAIIVLSFSRLFLHKFVTFFSKYAMKSNYLHERYRTKMSVL